MNDVLLDIRELVKYYPLKGGVFRRTVANVKAVDGVDLQIRKGECMGLVGESGCGKTTLGKTVLKLHEATSGRIYYDQSPDKIREVEQMLHSENAPERHRALSQLPDMDIIHMRRRDISRLRQKVNIVFQDPSNSLNPRMLVKDIVAEPLVAQKLIRSRDVEAKVLELLNVVGMGEGHLKRYPHEFSGGQRQRLAIARALATNPDFILMDEPTSALDVSVQAQILNLMKNLQSEFQLTYLFVTHHLLVVKYMANRIAVMYLGKLVELSDTKELFEKPLHPYTKALLSAIPVPDPDTGIERIILTGDVPNPVDPPAACRFHPRCEYAKDICREKEPMLEEAGADHIVACHRWREI
jgi:oligopeptide/dipeptide ABC transporter ATP-binding protein